MNHAVFISDLHLHPKQPEITARFMAFLEWAKTNTHSLYILGDFFHVWVGDDCIGQFEQEIAHALSQLRQSGIIIYWMPGNRDFLLGEKFLKMSQMIFLPDPSILALPGLRVMVTHGDAYCLSDYGHQFLRLLTRAQWQKKLILAIPKSIRMYFIHLIRKRSQKKSYKRPSQSKKYAINQQSLFLKMQSYQVTQVIYGHIHQPNIKLTDWRNRQMKEHILSDWDVQPMILCYNINKNLYLLSIV